MGTAVPCRTHLLVDAVTGHKLSGRCFFQLRSFFFATLCSIRTARMEAAPGRRIDRARKISFQAAFLLCFCQPWIRNGNGRKQSCRIGMQGVGKQFFGRGEFHDSACVHDGNAVAEVFHHGKVVGYEKDGQVGNSIEFKKNHYFGYRYYDDFDFVSFLNS